MKCALVASLAASLAATGAAAAQDFPSRCFPSDAASGGGVEANIRAVIVKNASRPAQPGMDGAVTAQIRAIKVGAPMRATIVDRANFQIPEGSTVYPVRATLATCTDYRTRVVHHVVERNYACFQRPTGGIDCSQTARSQDLQPDVQRSVNK